MSSRTLEKAKELIKDCHARHIDCGAFQLPRLPNRTIDVREPGSPTVHLHISNPDGEFADYLTLSYCWGGEQPVQTLRQNIGDMRNGISVASLPQTLRDAIETTRELGYKYLWADVLCIIQDDLEDRGREISMMGEIYCNSTLTIVAPTARTTREGYIEIEREQPSFFKMPLILPDGKMGEACIGHPCHWVHFSWELTPLSKRAWAFQESLLARRILYYGPYEVFFRCQSLGFTRLLPSYIKYSDDELTSLKDLSCSKDILASWSEIVRQYTFRNLTLLEDRPHAIAGIAAALEKSWEDKYVLGAWSGYFFELMTWFNVAGFPFHPSLKRSDRAPSWSWLSIDGHVGIHCKSKLRSDCVVTTDLSEVAKGARLKINCPVILEEEWPVLGFKMQTIYRDVECADESVGLRTFYLYLGSESEISESSQWSYAYMLIVVEEQTDVFRRIVLMRIHTRDSEVMEDVKQRMRNKRDICFV